MIYWVNSFNNPYCLLASSSIDFKDGIIFCELLGILRKHALKGVSKSKTQTIDSAKKNIEIALNEIKRIDKNLRIELTEDSVYNSEDCMYELLEIIKSLFDNQNTQNQMLSKNHRVQEIKPPIKYEELPLQSSTTRENYKSNKENAESQPHSESPSQKYNENELMNIQSPEFAKPDSIQEYSKYDNKIIPKTKKPLQSAPSHSSTAYYQNQNQNQLREFKDIRDIEPPHKFDTITKSAIVTTSNSKGQTPTRNQAKSTITFQKTADNRQVLTARQSTRMQNMGDIYEGSASRNIESIDNKSKNEYISKTPNRIINYYKSTTETEEEEQISAEPVDLKTKHKILSWLEDIHLIKPSASTVAEFPYYCRNGVLIADLIARAENLRSQSINGILRNPKSTTAILSNIRKFLQYLRRYQKMNARYLWAEKQILNGNEDVIWGLLDDMWVFYKGKTTRSLSTNKKTEFTPSRTTQSRIMKGIFFLINLSKSASWNISR